MASSRRHRGPRFFKDDILNSLNVTYRKVEALIPYARNPRTHSDAQVAKIAASMAEFGWTVPVLVSSDGEVIAGHGRIMAAAQLGLTEALTPQRSNGLFAMMTRIRRDADAALRDRGDWTGKPGPRDS